MCPSICLYICPSVHRFIHPSLNIEMNIQLQTAFCLAPWLLFVQILLYEIAKAVAAAFNTTSARAVIAAATSAAVAYGVVCVAIIKGIT